MEDAAELHEDEPEREDVYCTAILQGTSTLSSSAASSAVHLFGGAIAGRAHATGAAAAALGPSRHRVRRGG